MKNFTAISGQSIWDVCLNTYASLDLVSKLMKDNNFDNLNAKPLSGQSFLFDDTLIPDQNVTSSIDLNRVKYSTSRTNNGSIYSTVEGSVNSAAKAGGTVIPTTKDKVKYQQTAGASYTANVDNTTTIVFTGVPAGASIVQVTKEIKPLKPSEYSWNPTSVTLTLVGISLMANETLFIIWSQMITS
jgi:hypothetical protein